MSQARQIRGTMARGGGSSTSSQQSFIFENLALGPDCSAVTMIKDFPELAKGLDVAELGRIVSWITRNHSFESKPHRNSQ